MLLGIPLTGMGFFYFITFNTLCVFSCVSHLRAGFADPGVIIKQEVIIDWLIIWQQSPPDDMNPQRVKYCKKCKDSWKPERAHHCSECGNCVFKVRYHNGYN
jgi:hypothetical protein